MLYDYIKEQYQELEPIFIEDLQKENIPNAVLEEQLKELCEKELLQKYDVGIYFIPKKSQLKSAITPNADMVARFRFVSNRDNVNGFYTGCTFANQLGISTQVPKVIEIVSNNADVSSEEIWIGNRKFHVTKPIVEITRHILKGGVKIIRSMQMLKRKGWFYTVRECKYVEGFFIILSRRKH